MSHPDGIAIPVRLAPALPVWTIHGLKPTIVDVSDPGDETEEHAAAPAPSETIPAPLPEAMPAPPPPEPTAPTPAAAGGLNLWAVLSLVVGVAYFVIGISLGLAGQTAPRVMLALPVVAVVAGYVARNQIGSSTQRGRLLASAGISLGYVGLALLVFGLALYLLISR